MNLRSSANAYLLARVVERIPDPPPSAGCRVGGNEPALLAFLIEDHVRHLRHPVDQIEALYDRHPKRGAASPPDAARALSPWLVDVAYPQRLWRIARIHSPNRGR